MDRLVDAEIEQAKSDRAMAIVFLLVFTITSIVFFALGNPIAGGVFMSVPVLGLLRTMWTSSIGKSRTRAAEPTDNDQ
jgi:hypothetical protein